MSVSIGRAQELEKYWSTNIIDDSDKIRVKSADTSHASASCDNYPYENQKIISGTISYLTETWDETIQYKEGEYEYRSASGLFLLSSPSSGWPPSEEIFSSINELLDENAQIEPVRPLDRKSLWDFFTTADQIQEIIFIDSEGDSKEYTEVEEHGQAPVYSAVLVRADVSFDYKSSTITVHYNRGDVQIPRVSEDAREYVLQLFERDVVFKS